MTCCYVHDLIDLREVKGVLRIGVIQVRVIDSHAPLAILLRNNHDVGQLFMVLNLFDEPKELVNFAYYNFSALRMASSQLLYDWISLSPEVQTVLGHGRGNTRHIGVGPCENVRKLL